MKLVSDGFVDGGPLDHRFGWGATDPVGNISPLPNRNPGLSWSDVPPGTKSFAIYCVDVDVPSDKTDRNQEGRKISASVPRVELVHWILVDLPANLSEIAEGAFADGVVHGGQPGPDAPFGSRQGLNAFTDFLEGTPLAGKYYGYDGPCPPGNDEIDHRYEFRLYALDVDRLAVEGDFDYEQAIAAMEGHVLASTKLTGVFKLHG